MGLDAADLNLLPESMRGLVRRRLVKDPRRAVEKVLDCYGGDVSRLLDVCRCRIVFDDVRAAALCLRLIMRTLSVSVLRVKNTLTASHDAAASGGFRAVVLNVCLDTAETRRLGLENHVCEVQLVLREFAAVLRGADPSDYANLRALRGRVSLLFRASVSRTSVFPAGSVPSDELPGNEAFAHPQAEGGQRGLVVSSREFEVAGGTVHAQQGPEVEEGRGPDPTPSSTPTHHRSWFGLLQSIPYLGPNGSLPY
jgi:hypothetical protein